ncbi:hypothetical protein MJO29_007797 [Puccinia striiformis f. sp. tritici]|nr:hypothetical protein MJO29_007797 [Puccinia striiformis f. sp. tritici]
MFKSHLEDLVLRNGGTFNPRIRDNSQKRACHEPEVAPPSATNKRRPNLTNQEAGSRLPGHLTWQRWGVTFVESNDGVTSTSADQCDVIREVTGQQGGVKERGKEEEGLPTTSRKSDLKNWKKLQGRIDFAFQRRPACRQSGGENSRTPEREATFEAKSIDP